MNCHLLQHVKCLAEIPHWNIFFSRSVPASGFIPRFHLHVRPSWFSLYPSSRVTRGATERGRDRSSIFQPVSINLHPFLSSAWTVADFTAVELLYIVCVSLSSVKLLQRLVLGRKMPSGKCHFTDSLSPSLSECLTTNNMIVWSFAHLKRRQEKIVLQVHKGQLGLSEPQK